MVNITFYPANKTVSVKEGTLLPDAAMLAGVPVETPCGGKGVCGKCLVRILSGEVSFDEGWRISEDLISQGYVMICVSRVKNTDVSIQTFFDLEEEAGKFADKLSDYDRISPELKPQGPVDFIVKTAGLNVAPPKIGDGLSDFDRLKTAASNLLGGNVAICLDVVRKLPEVLRVGSGVEKSGKIFIRYFFDNNIYSKSHIATCGDTNIRNEIHFHSLYTIVDVSAESKPSYAVAVDLGTTTIAATICGENGLPLAVRTSYNGQIKCGLDIISRINYASKPEKLTELRDKAVGTINGLLNDLAADLEIDLRDIVNLSLSGNTTMIHMLLALPSEYIRLEPYTPAIYKVPYYTAGQIGIDIYKDIPIDISTSIGSYLGGDIISGILCTSLAADSDELCLFIDIGTNGEIVLGNNEFLIGCACSAGPAFEGGGISCGKRASNGAIDRVVIDPVNDNVDYYVIGDVTPNGICGSGMISLITQLLKAGYIDAAGKLMENSSSRISGHTRNRSFHITDSLFITENDISNIIRAKAAVFSACRILLKSVEMDFNDIDKIYIAGGFGRYLDLDDIAAIGLVPPLPKEKFNYIGNSSLIGTFMAMVSEQHREIRNKLASNVTYLDLSVEVGYMDEYMAAMFLPHTDTELFTEFKM